MKISGSWASLLRGVSQQPPMVRQAGQHAEQVNLLSDPVGGLTRRRGSVYQNGLIVGATTYQPYIDAIMAGAGGYRKIEHTSEGKEYVVLIREALTDPSYGSGGVELPAVVCYNLTDSAFVPLSPDLITLERATLLGRNGVQAAVSVGKYIVHAVKGEVHTSEAAGRWDSIDQRYPVVWVRGGAYSRTYKVSIPGGASFAYTTPGPGAPGAGEAISPENIAAQLVASAAAAGLSVIRAGSHMYLNGLLGEIAVSDGGDGSLLLGLGRTVDSISKLPIMAIHGTIIKIQTGATEAFYMEAISKSPSAPLAEVVWRECAGQSQGGNVALGLMVVEGGTLRLGVSTRINATNPPQLVPAGAGDVTNNPPPAFLRGLPITYLGIFQDRLMVAAGAAVAVSAAGDYFNFFRSSVVTVPIKDPFEMIAQGGEDDVLRHSVVYNRNLVIFGDKRQYIISGQPALTPTSANMAVMTTYAYAAETAPLAAGGQIYYARNREGNVGLHQIQPGAFVDSAESFPASAQIGDYIEAPAAQLEAAPGAPSLLMIRSRTSPRTIVTFSYLDTPEGRKQDAWSRWEFSPACGALLTCKSTPNGVLLLWARSSGLGVYLVADLLPLATQLGPLPYLDSMRRLSTVVTGNTEVTLSAGPQWAVALDGTTDRALIGAPLPERAVLQAEYPSEFSSAWVGCYFDSYVDLTNPLIRDSTGLAVQDGRLVITKVTLNFRDSAGSIATIVSGGAASSYKFNARVLGSVLNIIGKVPVASASHTVAVGRETREFTMRISAREWLPFTLVGISWTGQSFNRTPRA